MSKIFSKTVLAVLTTGLTMALTAAQPTSPATKTLPGHVPAVLSTLTLTSHLAGTNILHLALGLPVQDPAALNAKVQAVSDPASPSFRHYLTAAQFAEQFGPTAETYQSVIDFAQANGFSVTTNSANRMLLEVDARAADVERAFNVTLNVYEHPTEHYSFYSPTTEPSVPATLSLLDVSGLNSYVRPHPKFRKATNNIASPKFGSGQSGAYLGDDFRKAYVPGTTLNGAGQKIALFQADGYLASDIAAYEQLAGLPSVALTNILLQGFSGFPTPFGGQGEVTLDIDMCIAMAPGISQILVYEIDPLRYIPNIVLGRIANDNAASIVSCSWGWSGGPSATTDQIFQQMILQGQTFFDASGDVCAFLPPGQPGSVDDPTVPNAPSDNPYITQVGGTTLDTSGPHGRRLSETVWNWAISIDPIYDGVGSSGGISGYYALPTWQQGISMSSNQGSTTFRNLPDVALTGDNCDVVLNGAENAFGGTSCAAPLWAGFTALINQQAALNGSGPVGFLNPALYALAKTAAYTNVFNDITTGNNTWSSSPASFYAVPGFDLCTGLGTPKGTNLIFALVAMGPGTNSVPTISAPPGPWGTNLTLMNGSNPNGAWFLFVQDDAVQDTGMITNGWYVTLTTADLVGQASDSAIYASQTNISLPYATNCTLTLSVTNYGPSASSNVLVTDTLPVGGLTLVSSNRTAGVVSVFDSTLSWNVGTLQANAGASITLVLHSIAGGTFTNSATVSSTTADPNPDDDAILSAITVGAPPAPPVLTTFSFPGGTNGFRLTVTGDPGYQTVVQASTNLFNWVNLFTGTPPFIYTNFGTTNYPQRFYRAVVGP